VITIKKLANHMKNFKKQNMLRIAFMICISAILIIPTTSAMNFQAEVRIDSTEHAIFISSHWHGQEMTGETEMMQSFRDFKIIEEETYTANITLKNSGRFLHNANVTIHFEYSGLSVWTQGEIGQFNLDAVIMLSIPDLPAPEIIDWSDASATLIWEAHDYFNRDVKFEHKVDIRLYTVNFKAVQPEFVDTNIGQSNKPLSNEETEDPFALSSTSGATILKIWEGSESSKSLISKGLGPILRIRVSFSSNVNGFHASYGLTSLTHNNWYDTYIHYWGGSYSAGSTWVFGLHLGWNFANSKYVFGQGEYKFKDVLIYGVSNSKTWYHEKLNDPLNNYDDFQVEQSSSSNDDRVVFLSAIYDTYIISNNNFLDNNAHT
jgi:hypothetical protein